jgi:ABC-2 type transport system permease protein
MNTFVGTLTLTRLALRRDRVVVPVWVLVMVGMTASTASTGKDLFPTVASRVDAAASINGSPAFVAMLGRIYDPTSLGNTSLIKLTTFGAAMIAVIAIMLVVRHTRREEETGRIELLGATVVGRHSALAAALTVTVATMLLIGVLTALMLTATGLPAGGSWAFGMAWATTGVAFAVIAAVAAQLTVSSRSANGIALSGLAVTYALRAVGDTSGTAGQPAFWWWLSPIAWGQQVRAFTGDRWSVLALPVVFSLVVAVVAFALAARRDLGAGLLPDRAGAPVAARWANSTLGLAWRLQRGMLAAWAIGYVLLGFLTGNLAGSVGSFASTNQLRDLIRKLGGTQALTDAFLAYMFSFTALFTAAYGITVALRLRGEEETGHAEQLLATAVPRRTWIASHITIAMLGTTALSLLAGITAGIANALHTGSAADVAPSVAGVVVYLPAVWLLTGIVVLLFGYLPRAATLAWGLLVAFFLLDDLGALLSLPAWVRDLSPFSHIPKLPGATMSWMPVVILTLLAGVLLAAGATRFHNRDLTTA